MFKWEERAVQRLPPLSYCHPFPGMDLWSWTQTAQRPPHPYPLLRSSPTPRQRQPLGSQSKACSVSLGKSVTLSEPRFPHLCNEGLGQEERAHAQ